MKRFIIVLFALLFITTGCQKEEKIENPIVTMTIKDYGEVKLELYPSIVYNTVANFVSLIEDGFYNENTIHRLVENFVIQGGDPTATGTGGPGYTIKGEFALNGVNNGIVHETGVISMARGDDYNSAGSQFFIVLDDSARYSLDGKYASFGKVIEGMDVIDNIERSGLEIKENSSGMLVNPLTIESMTVDTKGHDYQLEKYQKN